MLNTQMWSCLKHLRSPLVVLGLAAWSPAQTTGGVIFGTSADATFSAVPQASIEIVHVETGITYATQSDEKGEFRVADLPPGNYRIVVEKAGFARLIRGPVALRLQ